MPFWRDPARSTDTLAAPGTPEILRGYALFRRLCPQPLPQGKALREGEPSRTDSSELPSAPLSASLPQGSALGEGRGGGIPLSTSNPTYAIALGIALLVFACVDLTLASRSRRDSAAVAPPDALRVEVLAQQWAWRFRYAGPDGVFDTDDDVTTLNDLRLPVGRAVSLQVRSLDVAHGLFIPMLRARVDAWPGRTGRGWFRPAREGDAELACSSLCGTNHYQMRARVTVLSAEGYTRWMDGLLDDQRRLDAASGSARTGPWGWPWQP